jgi:hypothetical protein
MKYFLIRYQFKNGSRDEWHREIEQFVRAVEDDPILNGRISYRSMKGRDDSEYYHLAEAADEQAIKDLGERDFFKRYTEKTELVSGGGVEVLPLEMIAETKPRAYTRS